MQICIVHVKLIFIYIAFYFLKRILSYCFLFFWKLKQIFLITVGWDKTSWSRKKFFSDTSDSNLMRSNDFHFITSLKIYRIAEAGKNALRTLLFINWKIVSNRRYFFRNRRETRCFWSFEKQIRRCCSQCYLRFAFEKCTFQLLSDVHFIQKPHQLSCILFSR